MNSSISNSELEVAQEAGGADPYSRWLAVFLAVAITAGATLWLAVILIDPFSTGRLTPIIRVDVATRNALLGHAARVRDPRFDTAIIGNSHAIPLDPNRIGDATGLHIAQLGFPAIDPAEQFTIGGAFVRHHPGAAAIVVVLDDYSCAVEEKVVRAPAMFPTFLFEGSNWNYVRHILFPAAVAAAVWRVGILLGFAHEPDRVDGFDPFRYPALGRQQRIARILNYLSQSEAPVQGAPILALPLVEALIAGLAPQTALVLYFTPTPVNALPVPESAAADWLAACKARYKALTDARPHSVFVDRMVDDSFTRDTDNFEDFTHIRNEVAPVLEKDIIKALSTSLLAGNR